MLKRKSEFLSYINNITIEFDNAVNIVPFLLKDSQIRFEALKTNVCHSIENGELLVPIIGGFSAGKSTAINKIIGREILPVKMTAETAIPAELRFSSDEYLLALRNDGKEERYSLSDLPMLSQNASQYEVIKVFVNSPMIKQIEPFILVDMPGFDSNLEQHNQAILRYLTRGAFYLYLVNCQDGALHTQGVRRLNEIIEMDRQFAIFITKKDLLPIHNLNDVKMFIDDQVIMNFGTGIQIDCIDMNDVSSLVSVLQLANPDALFNRQFINIVKDLYYTVSADMNSTIIALQKSKEEGLVQIEGLKKSLSSIENERERNLRLIQTGAVLNAQSRIVNRIEHDLNNAINELVPLVRSDNGALNRAITDLIRNSLIIELQKTTSHISNDVVRSLSTSLNLEISTNFNMTEDWIDNLISGLQSEVMNMLVSAKTLHESGDNSSSGGLMNILSNIALFIPNPLAKVIFAILPGIIGQFFGSIKASREQERYSDAIRNQIIPDIIRNVKPEISRSLTQITETLSQAVSEQFVMKINEQKAILEKAQTEFNESKEDSEIKILELKKINQKINTLTEENFI